LPEVLTVIGDLIWNGSFHGRFADKDYAIEQFHRHNEHVRHKVPSDGLLEWRATEGWEPLCAFLGVATPAAPFPHLNDTASFRQMVGLPPGR
jgi:Sulfotransferase domain